MNTNEKFLTILNDGFDRITSKVSVDYKQSALMKDAKHIELIERYAKVLSHHYVGKFATLCTAVSNADMIDAEQKKQVFKSLQQRVDEIVDDFPAKYDTTLKQVKKYFGQSYSANCLNNVTAECFVDDLNAERKNIVEWASSIQLDDDGAKVASATPNEKASA